MLCETDIKNLVKNGLKSNKTILETGDNTHIYKRKEYANGRIRHRKTQIRNNRFIVWY